MFHTTAHDEGVTRSNVHGLSLAGDLEVPMHNIDDLLVEVAVHLPNPAFHHLMFRKKQFVVVSKDAASQTCFRE
jgi:hypothetical protein